MREQWKPCGRGYECSTLGNVRKGGRPVKPWFQDGHWYVCVNRKNHRVSRLVARAFLKLKADQWVRLRCGPSPTLDNLVVCSARGEQRWTSKLREADVRAIYRSDKSLAALARLYAVSPSCIAAIKRGRNWSAITKRG